MKLKYSVNPYIPATRQRHLVYVLVEVDPDPTDGVPRRRGLPRDAQTQATTPINLSLVVDASRSMSIPILTETQFNELKAQGTAGRQTSPALKTVDGVKVWQFQVPKGFQLDAPSNMDFTKEALRIVADYLRPIDRFSLVAFAEDALLMVAQTSFGATTFGTQKHELLQAIDRLDQIDLGDETFMARGMEMGYKQALPDATSDTIGRMVVLTDGYTKDEHAAYTWTRQVKKEGIVVSTMGLGLDFNEELLISLADISGGHAYFIEDPKEIPDAFRQELAGAQSITWRDLSLVLSLPADVTLRRAHRVKPAIAVAPLRGGRSRLAIPLGDLESEAPPAALLELVVPPHPAGTYRLAQITLHGRRADAVHRAGSDTSLLSIDRQDVLARYTEKPSLAKQTDAHLMSVIQAVSAFKLQSQAMEEAHRGNIAGATRRLRLAGERLIEMGQKDLGNTMLIEAELMEKEGQMSAEGTKKLRYGTRKLKNRE